MITTVWDGCHRDAPEFPEVQAFGELKWRDYLLRGMLPRSIAVLTDSSILADRLAIRYGVDRERLIAMPFSAAPHLASAETAANPEGVPANLEAGYFFYPAQFWPHKNHIRLLEALRMLKDRGVERRVVFSGGDHGGLARVRAQARALDVDALVRFVGFVPPEEMAGLYRAAAAVVMPSYFGPTNLPPLEAWTMRRPLICSDVIAEQVGDAALVFDPDDATALADAMVSAMDPEIAARLVANGLLRLEELAAARSAAEVRLSETLERFARRRLCWR
jgi:glycosyltransferase involved in cell wall biosynthesis